MKGIARRLLDDVQARHRGECLRQEGREQKQGCKRAEREWNESRQRSMKVHRQEYERTLKH